MPLYYLVEFSSLLTDDSCQNFSVFHMFDILKPGGRVPFIHSFKLVARILIHLSFFILRFCYWLCSGKNVFGPVCLNE